MKNQVITERKNGLLTIILNNPDKLNCMGFDMLRSLEEIIDSADTDNKFYCIVFMGAGDRAFSTGANLKEFQQLNEDQSVEWIELGNRLFNKIEKLSKPTVALVNGYALGGGLELALACDFRIGTETAALGCPELLHGWLPGWGGMTRLRKLIGEIKAKELIFTGKKISASQAHSIGLLNFITDSFENVEIQEFLEQLASLNPVAFKLAKASVMDNSRTTADSDVQFDVLAMKIAKTSVVT